MNVHMSNDFMSVLLGVFSESLPVRNVMNMSPISRGYGAVAVSCYSFSAHAQADMYMFR
jgi:hypothetical protein